MRTDPKEQVERARQAVREAAVAAPRIALAVVLPIWLCSWFYAPGVKLPWVALLLAVVSAGPLLLGLEFLEQLDNTNRPALRKANTPIPPAFEPPLGHRFYLASVVWAIVCGHVAARAVTQLGVTPYCAGVSMLVVQSAIGPGIYLVRPLLAAGANYQLVLSSLLVGNWLSAALAPEVFFALLVHELPAS